MLLPTIPAILHGLDPAVRERLVRSLPERQVRALARAFSEWGHSGQLAPATTETGEDWRTWVLMAGRWFGWMRPSRLHLMSVVRYQFGHSRSRRSVSD